MRLMRPHRVVAAALALGLVGAAPGRVLAQESEDRVSREGEYRGVTPGEAPPFKERRKKILSWIGFQPGEGGRARVFVQLSSQVRISQQVDSGALVIRLEGARYRNANTGRRLDARFFDSALQQVTSRRVARRRARGGEPAEPAGIELRLELKHPSAAREATVSTQSERDGFFYIFVDIGPAAGGGAIRASPLDEPE